LVAELSIARAAARKNGQPLTALIVGANLLAKRFGDEGITPI